MDPAGATGDLTDRDPDQDFFVGHSTEDKRQRVTPEQKKTNDYLWFKVVEGWSNQGYAPPRCQKQAPLANRGGVLSPLGPREVVSWARPCWASRTPKHKHPFPSSGRLVDFPCLAPRFAPSTKVSHAAWSLPGPYPPCRGPRPRGPGPGLLLPALLLHRCRRPLPGARSTLWPRASARA